MRVRDAGKCARGTSQGEDNKAIAAVNISADALQDMIDDILAAVGLDTGQPVVRR